MRTFKWTPSIIPIFLLTVMVASFLTMNQIGQIKANETLPVIQILPSKYNIENISTFFPINITISNVTDLYGWEVKICYLKNIIRCINVTEGPFLRSSNETFWVPPVINNEYNETHGMVHLACTLIRKVPGVSGSGTLATLVFHAVGSGNTTLHLFDTKLADSHTSSIPHETSDGSVEVSEFHDLAVIGITPLKTIVSEGFNVQVMVTIKNKGNRIETFNVTLYANSTAIEMKEITLPSETSTNATFTWDTDGWQKGRYTIWAYVWPVHGETETADNTYVDGQVLITLTGDVDGNFRVDMIDVGLVCDAFGSEPGAPNWNKNADLDGNNRADMIDIGIVCDNFGKEISPIFFIF